MLNSAACRSKTARAPARSPCYEKSGRGKGLMQGCGLRCRRAYETSRNAFQGRTAALSRASHAECGRMLTILDSTLVAMIDAMDVSGSEYSWPPQHAWRRDALSVRSRVPRGE